MNDAINLISFVELRAVLHSQFCAMNASQLELGEWYRVAKRGVVNVSTNEWRWILHGDGARFTNRIGVSIDIIKMDNDPRTFTLWEIEDHLCSLGHSDEEAEMLAEDFAGRGLIKQIPSDQSYFQLA